jgi:uncharacterized protein DUF6600/FecR-like protein
MKRILLPMLVVMTGAMLWSQEQIPNGQPGPPPGSQPSGQPDGQYETGRAVARISVLSGDVSVRRGDSGDVVAAALNGPLMADDRLLTGSSSSAEVQLDYANVIRIAPNSEVRFTGMDVRGFQMQVAAGMVTFRVLRPSQAQTEVDTPSVAVHPLGQGTYRVVVRDDGTSEITLRSGQAEIFSANGSERLQAGQTMNARGTGADTEFQVVQAIPPDSWDRWNDDRDNYLSRSQAYQHVSPDVYGAEDLDQSGRWVNDPTYGSVWAPTVQPGWAPYQNGRWVWEDYYGWTWVSADPWGWAPYHYGRWFMGPVGWCWYPGPVYGRAFWSPALVGFFGFGGGFGVGVGFGFGGIGWVALAPFEVFHPWWGRGYYAGFGGGAFGRANIVNGNVVSTFRNARITGAVTGVNTADFGRRAQFTSLNRSQIQSAGLVHGALPVAPDRSSLRMSDRAASGNVAQSRAQSFASHTQAPRVQHVSFDQQQRGMQQMSRSNLTQQGGAGTGNSSFERSMPNTGARSAGPSGNASAGTGGASNATHGWGRFGEPIHGTGGSTAQAKAGGSSGGWQHFEGAQANGGAGARNNFAGGGQPVHISPSIVQQRTPGNSSPSAQAPRGGSSSNYSAPRSQAPQSNGGGARSFGGGSARPSGGGGHASGGGHNGGHR